MPDGASPLLYYWAVVQAALAIPDWKNVYYAWQVFLPAAIAAYLIGSIPFGLLLSRVAGLGDIRRIGSGNIGATNVLRTGNKMLAAATLLLDGGKGWLAVAIAYFWFGPDIVFFAAVFVTLGHMFPVWLGFRGGKGVATTFGVLLGLSWHAGIAAIVLWLVVALLFRYSSLAALVSVAATPVIGWFLFLPQVSGVGLILAVLVWIRHAPNISRLLRGEESKIRLRKTPPPGD